MRLIHAEPFGGVLRVGEPGVVRFSVLFRYHRLVPVPVWGPLGGPSGGSTGWIPRGGSPEVPQRSWVDSGTILGRFWVDSGLILDDFG